MLAGILVFAACLYLIGLRADRVNAHRVSNSHVRREGGMPAPGANRGSTRASLAVRYQARPVLTEPDGKWARSSQIATPIKALAGRVASGSVSTRDDRAYWKHIAYLRGRRIRQLKAVLLARPSVSEAINLACTVYGQCDTLWRKARCESGLQADPPHNNISRGLFQFQPGTWATTPYRGFDILSPYANALAAGWMHTVAHRGNEWQCH